MNILVTGGAGFIGRAVVKYIINETSDTVLNIDCLTYAGNLSSVEMFSSNERYQFSKIDICNYEELKKVFLDFSPDIVMHLAAESHVDKSITGPKKFIETNIIGTYNLLEISKLYSQTNNLRFHHVSTDEVYGDLEDGEFFYETTPYAPSSPYSASKASSDHLVRAWHRTFQLPILITNCSNNYGPYQYPEKLIPLMLINSLHNKKLPVYGDGQQIRDWLYVTDHARALYLVATKGKIGETYNIGGHNEMTNLQVINTICDYLNDIKENDIDYKSLISYVTDRPGHDTRYAINSSKIQNELGWQPIENFQSGIKKTIKWYLNNEKWWQSILNKKH